MQPYQLNEATLQVPDGWRDTTINAFVLPAEAGSSASLVITRDPEAGDAEANAYADQQLVKSAQQLPAYKLVARAQCVIAGQAAVQSDFTWVTPDRVSVRQRQACLRAGSVMLVLTLSARDEAFTALEPTWSDVVASLRLPPARQ